MCSLVFRVVQYFLLRGVPHLGIAVSLQTFTDHFALKTIYVSWHKITSRLYLTQKITAYQNIELTNAYRRQSR